ncbi:MAG: hypothetical protein LC104_14490 [Bacteroidales bacterium]|nr:hypothetical protein [Bacteroidales bacterium]
MRPSVQRNGVNMNSPTPGIPHGEYDGPDEDWTVTEEDIRQAEERLARGESVALFTSIFKRAITGDGMFGDVGIDQPDDDDDDDDDDDQEQE